MTDKSPQSIACPFSVIIDTAEQQPFTFDGLRCDARQHEAPLVVTTERQCLGRHPNQLGDYSLSGGVGWCHVERKSIEDLHGTLLGFADGRRGRFEKELSNLAAIEAALVVVESSFEGMIQAAPSFGKKTAAQNAKTLMRSVLAFQQDYKVGWCFAGSRRMAEIATFRFLERFWQKRQEKLKAEAKASKQKQIAEFAEL